MLCPDCGRSDGFCDCAVVGPPCHRGGSPEATATVPPAGAVTEAKAEGTFGPSSGTDGRHCEVPEPPGGTDWAGSLLEFLRDFESASPQPNRPAPGDEPGRNRPVGRGPLELDLGQEGPLAATAPVTEPTSQTVLPDMS